jgi:mannose-6-phosphate isomerase-like protein (cupin superfamily)/protein-L-isoaspartate O-methyltransferase
MKMRPLADGYDYLAPDGSEIRLLPDTPRAGLCHCTLPKGGTSLPIRHRTVDEIWYFLEGDGMVWRRAGDAESVVHVAPRSCLTIEKGTHFQFRNVGTGPLVFLIATIPRWPGKEEAVAVKGQWAAGEGPATETPMALVSGFYTEKDAKEFQTAFSLREAVARLKAFASTLERDRRVLDAGCGVGAEALVLRKMGHRIVGVDLTPSNIERFRKTLPGAKAYVADLRELDRLDLKPGSFDAITCLYVFMHFTRADARAVLRHFHRLLKTKGRLFLATHVLMAESRLRADTKVADVIHHDWSLPDLLYLLHDAGFEMDTLNVDNSYRERGFRIRQAYFTVVR